MTTDAGDTTATGGVRFLGQRRTYWRLLVRGAGLLVVTLGIYRNAPANVLATTE